MTNEKIARINALAKKAREEGLTDDEKNEQAALRADYVQGIRRSVAAQIENTDVIDETGKKMPLKEAFKRT
ncbi:MAG: DUF896 domain-containing protein [Pygmaiobacter sp.]